jgi:hypothetical protein
MKTLNILKTNILKPFEHPLALIVVTVFVLLTAVLFFYPKTSSSLMTEFAVQQWINNGIPERRARADVEKNNIYCTCLGFERISKSTSYTSSYVCYGVVSNCKINR